MVKIIKVPAINGLGMTEGTELGPDRISEEGEVLKVDRGNVHEQEKIIYEKAKSLNEKVIFIGGDHSISYPITRAFFEKNPALKIIVLDAHPDLMPPMKNPTHEEWLSALIAKGFKAENVLLIGARNIDPKEKDYSVETIVIEDIGFCDKKINDFVGNGPIYLSIDIDFFDAEVAPATGYPEKNGAERGEGLSLIKEIVSSGNIIGADIVEVNPTKRGAEKTIGLAREIIEILKK
ncbi:MAG: arginase family protein [archaeon]|nr:arginase family protein [archaeon]MCR4323648.1 arginase family protein [Nanoarchaeota archaeon]